MVSGMISFRVFVRRHTLLLYFILTFLVTWAAWLPMLATGEQDLLRAVGTFAPAVTALVLTALIEGRAGLQRIGRQMVRWRVAPGWYGVALVAAPALILAAVWLAVWSGMAKPLFNDPRQLYLVVPAFLYVLFFSVLGEEIGWRGFAQARLQQSIGALKASLLVGAAWGVWHLPLFFIPGNFHTAIPLTAFLLETLALSVVMAWLYNGSGRSLLMVHLFHAASNTALGVLPVLPMDTGGDTRALWIAIVLLCLWSALLMVRLDPDSLSAYRTRRDQGKPTA